MTTAMTHKEYVANDGRYCPVCWSVELRSDPPEVYGGSAGQRMYCNACGAAWLAVFFLVKYTDLEAAHD